MPNKKELRRRHSEYCTFASYCDKPHNCMAGDFCDAYERDPAHPSGLIKDLEVQTVEAEYAGIVALDRAWGDL